jgi:hypothetical protein
MLRRVIESRFFLAWMLSAYLGLWLYFHAPFPGRHPLLAMIELQRPAIFKGLKLGYNLMLFSTPMIAFSMLFSLAYIFVMRREPEIDIQPLPPYTDPRERERLEVIIGELHHPRKPKPAANPQWLTIPERGLYTGIAILGAIGSGKTAGCMYPFANQVLGFRAQDKERKASGLFLEVKGDFCFKVQEILKANGRAEDYIEVSFDSEFCYNPLHNDLEAYTLAYGIASLLNNLFEPPRVYRRQVDLSYATLAGHPSEA